MTLRRFVDHTVIDIPTSYERTASRHRDRNDGHRRALRRRGSP